MSVQGNRSPPNVPRSHSRLHWSIMPSHSYDIVFHYYEGHYLLVVFCASNTTWK
jgi:hypothetical protein